MSKAQKKEEKIFNENLGWAKDILDVSKPLVVEPFEDVKRPAPAKLPTVDEPVVEKKMGRPKIKGAMVSMSLRLEEDINQRLQSLTDEKGLIKNTVINNFIDYCLKNNISPI